MDMVADQVSYRVRRRTQSQFIVRCSFPMQVDRNPLSQPANKLRYTRYRDGV